MAEVDGIFRFRTYLDDYDDFQKAKTRFKKLS